MRYTSPRAAETRSPAGSLEKAYRPVKGALEEVERRLVSPESLESLSVFLGLQGDSGAVKAAEKYVIEAGGKRLRAALVLLAVRLCGKPAEKAVSLAVGIELFHTASLVIDDMIVDAGVRRSRPTVHRRWDESGALSAALGLQLRALPAFLESMKSASDPPALLSIVGQTVTRVLWGAVLQHRQRMNYDMDENGYLEIIGHKTAALFEACTEGGAVVAGSPPGVRKSLRRYGTRLGLAFQLTDDFLDYAGDPRKMGKPTGSDITEGRVTLPMIHFLACTSAAGRAKMMKLVPPRRKKPLPLKEISGLLEERDSMEYCMKRAREESAKAQKSLAALPDRPERESMKIIASMASGREA